MAGRGLSFIGCGLAGLGWSLLLIGLSFPENPVVLFGHTLSLNHADLAIIAQNAILSGLGLAIIGALRSGFGALHRFFEAVMQRSELAKFAEPPSQPVSERIVPEKNMSVSRELKPNHLVQRGRMHDRPFIKFPDGSVEVETILGTRRFISMDEAREFIGPD